MNEDIVHLSAARQAELIRARQLSPVALVRAYLERIDRLDGRLRAYITVTREAALAAARQAEDAVMRGAPLGPQHGVTLGVKDQFARDGAEIVQMSPAESSRFFLAELEKWGKVVKEANIKAQ